MRHVSSIEIAKNDQACPVENPVVEGHDIMKDDMKTSSEKEQTPPVTYVIDNNSPNPKSWVKLMDPETNTSLVLYKDTRDNILKKSHWLYDSEIHAGQILLKTKFPFADGLRDPAVEGELVVPAVSEFAQVINTGSHWVCLSTISSIPGTLKIYDSLFIKPNPIAIRHSCRLLMHTGNQVTFLNEKVQKQTNTNDCGLFALAFATDLCHGIDPASQCYDPQHMREHYVHCLDSQEMVPFPKTSRRVPFHITNRKTTVAIYCVCRMPNDKQEYAQCYQCDGWYHPTCVSIPEWVLNTNRRWRCDICRCKNAKKTNLNQS